MKLVSLILMALCLLSGCDTLRFAPNETQKQNAWLHNRTAEFVADAAKSENTSEKLKGLTNLSAMQSRAITSYYGMPQEFPKADTADDVLSQSNIQLAQQATADAAQRSDLWQIADNGLELGIGHCRDSLAECLAQGLCNFCATQRQNRKPSKKSSKATNSLNSKTAPPQMISKKRRKINHPKPASLSRR